MSKLNRNDLCSCGSGVKFKKCCNINQVKKNSSHNIEKILLDTAVKYFNNNNLHLAEKYILELLQVNPRNDSALYLLSAIAYKTGNLEPAKFLLEKALISKPNNELYLYHLGVIYRDLQNLEKAEEYFHYALKYKHDYIDALHGVASIYHIKEDFEQAALIYEKILQINFNDVQAKHLLASCSTAKLRKASDQYVSKIFDSYSKNFDEHLQNALSYKTPVIIADLIFKYSSNISSKLNILDLGCGTGLVAEYTKKLRADVNFYGVDLSKGMLEKAKEKNLYKNLTCIDIEKYLSKNSKYYNFIVAADVFVYIGELAKIFEQISKIISKNGKFIFSIELLNNNNENFILQNSARFAHNDEYVRKLVHENNLIIIEDIETVIRTERSKPVLGKLYVVGTS